MGVGMFLFLIKNLILDIANMTKELSTNNGADSAAFKELLHVIMFWIQNKFGLKLEPTRNDN